MGRKKKEISEEMVYELASIGCTYDEMSRVLGIDKAQLTRRFKDVIEEGSEEGKMSLRRKQLEVAMSGDRTMLIWLGKNLLNQSDRVKSDLTSGGNTIQPLSINVIDTATADALRKLTAGDKPSGN